ncbi:MAG: 16S rRNA (adenine(1518)-N(6)/adenine(1519)-N(6))-dimethyltransferase RsmA [Acidobacteriota bacterium]|nr:16S rRNA (adenine(1518)-N(6)/adenine(1519)-N(6))-dimethyltransferase RsmA [Acidobacteriota bacterium]
MPRQTHSSTKPFAKKSFGQNFLVDKNYIDKIIAALRLRAGEDVIEIGAGRGALTEKLVETGARVTAIELDRDLIPLLKEKFAENENFSLVERDALKINFAGLIQNTKTENQKTKAKLVANLPYYISTAILQKLIDERDCFSGMVLMFQREVVERITAVPGNKERGFLTVLVEAYLAAEKLFDVPPAAFRPAPKIWSAVVRLTPKERVEIEDEKLFREIISAAFAQRRKTILNNLKSAPADLKKKIGDAEELLNDSRIDARRRAETLTSEEWLRVLISAKRL